jgi:hypothetical protein
MSTSTPKATTKTTTATAKATTAKKATPKPKTPEAEFSKDSTVTASHARLHPEVGPAKVLRDVFPNDTYIRVAFEDDGQVVTVHRKRLVAEQPAAA